MTARSHPHALELAGLIRLAQTQPELAYACRHTLVHTAAYGCLVRWARQALHQAAGETLEQLYPEAPLRDRFFQRAEALVQAAAQAPKA